jgi:hypothetical protein
VLPKDKWSRIYDILQKNGYVLHEVGPKKDEKYVFIGNISLDENGSQHQLQNLIEVLFAVAITKEHFKGKVIIDL